MTSDESMVGVRAGKGSHGYAITLWLLLFLFSLRVIGQALVASFQVPFLPSMGEWYSDLLPYHILLSVQLVILLMLGKITADFSRGAGFFVVPRRKMGRLLLWFSVVYFASMVLRYIVTMVIYPDRRWFGTGTIPVFFHLVLAAYLFTLGHFHARRNALPSQAVSCY